MSFDQRWAESNGFLASSFANGCVLSRAGSQPVRYLCFGVIRSYETIAMG
jgi:hypothetical protein